MTKSERERKEFDEKRARFSQLGDKVDPVEREREIAAYKRKAAAAAALTSTTDTTANPDGAGKATTTKTTSTPEVPDREIEAAMKAAADSDAVVAAVSLEEWARMNDGDRCPEHCIATAAELITGLPNIPLKTLAATCSLLRKLYDVVAAKWVLFDRIGIEMGAAVETVMIDEDRTVAMLHTPLDVHRKLMALPRESRPRHPLGPLLEDFWQEHLPRPAGRFAEVKPRRRGSLARLSGLSDQHTHLPGFPDASTAPAEPAGRPVLPEFTEEVAMPGCTNWMLWLFRRFDQAGGRSTSQGHGAPWDLRLWIYALLNLPVEKRDGRWHKESFSVEEVIGWLHPNGWSNQRRDWQKLPDALDAMRRLAYLPVPGIGYVAILYPSVIPSSPSDPFIEFTIRVPRIAAYGDRIIWPWLIKYGADSSLRFRTYLAVSAWMGNSARHGHPITRQISQPSYDSGGKRRRRKGGTIIRSVNRRIPNYAARFVSGLTDHDLTSMIGLDPDNKRHRHEARKVFERLHADTVIDLHRIVTGRHTRFAIFGPTADQDLTREGAADAAELLRRTTRNPNDPPTRASLSELATKATGPARRALVHALREIPRNELSAATVTAIARKLEDLPR